MMATIALLAGVIVLEAVPVYGYLRSTYLGRPVGVTWGMVGSFAGVAALCAAATLVPLRVGLRRMESFEF
jgi:hypothetical protein